MQTEPAKSILQRTKSTEWFGSEYNMNLYRGCCHGCIYCDSRSNCYHLENFDTVRAKENALPILRNEMARRVKTGVIGTGAMSDPYNPFEKIEMLTRHALELANAYGFGIAIATKGSLIARDADVLSDIRSHSPVICKITITSADDALAKKVEPHAPASSLRFAALETLAKKGIFSGVLLMPLLPFIEDTPENVRAIVKQTAQNGGRFIYFAPGMTLRDGNREYYYNKLQEIFPEQNLPQKYQNRYGTRYQCGSPRAKELWSIFTQACDEYGLLYKMQDIIRGYKQGYATQLSFL